LSLTTATKQLYINYICTFTAFTFLHMMLDSYKTLEEERNEKSWTLPAALLFVFGGLVVVYSSLHAETYSEISVGMLNPAESTNLANPFLGTWALDKSKDVNMDGFLQAFGVNWAKRKLAMSVNTVLQMSISEDATKLNILNSVSGETQPVPLNGAQFPVTIPNGDKGAATLSWDGVTMVINAELPSKQMSLVTRRMIVDGVMIQESTLTNKGKSIACTRTFNKQE